MNTRSSSIFKDSNVAKYLSLSSMTNMLLTPNNIVLVCKSHYVDCLIKEFDIDKSLGNLTYTPTTLTKEKILEKHVPLKFQPMMKN
jgi:hypothetical protein